MERDKIGLIDGVCGKLLIQSYNTSSCSEREKFISLIDDNIDNVSSLNFDYGLLGIFWSLSLVQNTIIFPDNLFQKQKNFDDFIYKSVVNYIQTDLSLNTGIIGKALYLYQRLMNEAEPNYYRRILMRESLVLATKEIDRLTLKKINTSKFNQNDIYELVQALNLLNAIKTIGINPLVIDTPLTNVKRKISQTILNQPIPASTNNLLLYMAKSTHDMDIQRNLLIQKFDLKSYSIQRTQLIEALMKENIEFWPLL